MFVLGRRHTAARFETELVLFAVPFSSNAPQTWRVPLIGPEAECEKGRAA